MSSRVPGPTVDQRVSVNSGARRKGAAKCVWTSVSSPRKKEDNVSCKARLPVLVSGPRTSYVEQLEPGHRSTHGHLGINEAIYNDGDTTNARK